MNTGNEIRPQNRRWGVRDWSHLLLMACLLLAGSAVVTHGAPNDPDRSRPNFLVILCDDLGYGDLSSYGHEVIETPHLDQLAAEGMRLTACYAAAPVCSPSRAGLLTGRTPSRVGVYDWIPGNHRMHLKEDEITVATLLNDAGYATAHVGKWHLNGKFNSDAQPQPDDHGFDHWLATQNNARPSHQNPKNFVRNGEPVGELEGFSCQLVADEAIRWLEKERSEDQPFFLYTCFHEPHEPVESPDELVREYLPEAKNRDEAEYFANVTNMDKAVGRMMAALDRLGLTEETLVFFTSDNGPETLNRYGGADRSYGSPGPLRGMKLWLYEGGIRVPGILRWPGRISPGEVSRTPVSGVDLLPTLCDLAGVPVPSDRAIDGASFAPLFDGQSIPREKPLYWYYYRSLGDPVAAMRIGSWSVLGESDALDRPNGVVKPGHSKLIKGADLTEFELYNLRKDLRQKRDLAEKYPERLEKLSKELRKAHQSMQEDAPAWD